MELFKLLGKIAIDNSEANESLGETQKKAKETSETIGKGNQNTRNSNKQTGSSFSSLKAKVNEYKAQGMSTSQAWRKASQDMKSSTEGAGNSMVGSFAKIGAAVATFLTTTAIIAFGSSCIQAAADASAMESQFSQVFGDLESKASKSLSGIADEAGISENRMKGSFTKIAAFAKTTGMNTKDALGLSERAMVAVADSAAFYDRSLEETTESLQSFLKGNYENDSALGLSCTETTRNAAANKLYGKSFNDLSESQKQLTLLQMVEDANKASGALGQAARESDTWTNVTGNLKQSWTDFQAVIGSYILPGAVETIKKLASGVQTLAEKVPEAVKWFKEHETVLQYVGIAVGTVAAAIGAYTIAQNLKNIAVTAGVAAEGAATVAMGAQVVATNIATAATSAFGAVMAFVTSPITLVVVAIGALIAIGVALYKNWDTVSAKAKELWSKVKNTFDKLKTSISNAVEGAKTAALNKFESLKSGAVNKFNSLKSSVVGKFNEIKNGISEKINGAKDKVKSAIDKIKGFFNFKWSLPKLKMPHPKISGKFSLNPPSVPKFSIEWYQKAMDNPMILTKPTIFDYNPMTGKARGGGEAGDELVGGKNTVMGMIAEAVASQNSGVVYYLQKIIQILADFFPQFMEAMQNMKLVTDDGTILAYYVPKIDKELGKIADQKGRGR